MQMKRSQIKGGCQIESNNFCDQITCISTSNKSSPCSSLSSLSPSSPSDNVNCIRHEVCKMDTLAGIAIKYGVEISDVRRLNGLATDLQMFAHKTLRIPCQGRHSTSCQEIGRIGHAATEVHAEIIDDFESLNLNTLRHPNTCSAIGPLDRHYGLPPIAKRRDPGHKPSNSLCLQNEDIHLIDKPAPKQHRRSQSLQTGVIAEENGVSKRLNKQYRTSTGSPDRSFNTGTIPTISLLVNKLLTIRKSASASSLQDLDIASSYSLFVATSKWNLLPKTFALPSLDGFHNPIASWRNKSAQD